MNDPRYTSPVGGMGTGVLPAKLQAAMDDLNKRFPGLGVTLFVFDFGGPMKGISYISNAERADMVRALREWLQKQARDS